MKIEPNLDGTPYIISLHYWRSLFPAYSRYQVNGDTFFGMRIGTSSSMSVIN
jgi:hypothetical protein